MHLLLFFSLGKAAAHIGSLSSEVSLSLLDMQHAHATASHVDRRRSHDIMPTCESADPSDASDSDCFIERWNLLVNFYPSHQALKTLEKKTISLESQTERLAGRLVANLTQNRKALFGSVGTPVKPSPLDGLVSFLRRQVFPLNNALYSWINDAFERLLSSVQDRLGPASQSDLKRIANETVTALNDFLNHSRTIASTELAFSHSILNASLVKATSVLEASTDQSVVLRQQRIGDEETRIGEDLNKKHARFADDISDLESKLQKSIDSLTGFGNKVHTAPESVRASLVSAIAVADTQIKEEGAKKTKYFIDSADQIVAAVAQHAESETSSASSTWKELLAQEVEVENQRVGKLNDQIERAAQSFENQMSEARSYLSEKINASAPQTRALDQTSKDLSNYMSGTANVVMDSTKSTAADQGIAQGHFLEIQNESRGKVRAVSKNSYSMRDSAIKSLISSITDAQSVSQSSISDRSMQISNAVSGLLSDSGRQGVHISDVNSRLLNSVRSAAAIGKSYIDRDFGSLKISDSSEQLRSLLSGVAGRLSDDALSESATEARTFYLLEQKLQRGFGSVKNALNGGTENLNDLRELLVRKSDSKYKKGLFDIENVRNVLSDSLLGVSHDSAESERGLYLSSQSWIERAVALLATALEESDEGVAKSLVSLKPSSLPSKDFDERRMRNVMMEVVESLSRFARKSYSETLANAPVVKADSNAVEALNRRAEQTDHDVSTIEEARVSSGDEISDKFKNRLRVLLSADGIGNEKAKTASLRSESEQEMFAYLARLMRGEKSLVRSRVEKSNAIADLRSGLTAVQKGETILRNDLEHVTSSSVNAERSTIKGLYDGIVSSEAFQGKRFSEVVAELGRNISLAKHTMKQKLDSFEFEANQSVAGIPQKMLYVLNQSAGNYRLTAARLNASVNLLREKIALASSSEEKQRLIGDQILLQRIANLAGTVSASHDHLLGNISTQSEAGFSDLASTEKSLQIVADMIGEHSGLTRNGFFEISPIAHQASDLLNGLRLMVNQTIGKTAFEAAETVRNSTFSLGLQNGQQNLLSKQLLSLVLNLGLHSDERIKNQTTHLVVADKMGKKLEISSNEARRSLDRLVDAVLHQVLSANSLSVNQSSNSINDVQLNLSVMRNAMFNFIGLWTEIARSVSSRFSLNDLNLTDHFRGIDLNNSNVLESSDQAVSNTAWRLGNFHDELLESETDLKNESWDSLLAKSVALINGLNYDHNARAVHISDLLDKVTNISSNVTDETLNEIQKELLE